MRFMIIVKASAESEAAGMSASSLLAELGSFQQELALAGVLLDGAALKDSAQGWRVAIEADGQRRVDDGPDTQAPERIAGYTLIQVRSREEALEWSRRYPNPALQGCCRHIEVWPLCEAEAFVRRVG